MKRRVLSLFLALLIMSTITVPAFAESRDIEVNYDICVAAFDTDSIFCELGARKLIMPRGHRDMHITIGSTYSIDTYADLTETAPGNNASWWELIAIILGFVNETPPKMAMNVYSIRFYDYSGNPVYSGTIPNGESVNLFVGENVDYINVWSWYDVPSGASPTPMYKGQMYYYGAAED